MRENVKLVSLLLILVLLVAACAPTSEVVEKVVKETVVVEKEVEVEVTKEVEVVKEVVVTPTPKPEPTEVPPPAEVEDDFYFSNGEKIPVTIAPDQIGIVANEGVAAEQIEAFASELGLKLIREVSESMFILGLSQPLDRGSLIQFAREVKSGGEQLLREAGLVVTTEVDPTPMMLTDEFIALFNPEVTQEKIDEFIRFNDVEIVSPDPFVKNQFLLKVTEASRIDALKMANQFHESPLTEFSHPNFWKAVWKAGCVDFEDPPLGTVYHVGGTFTDSGANITVQSFQWGNGQWTNAGFTEVGNAGDAGGSGQEVEVNNVNLSFDFGGPWEGLRLSFGEYGGNLNIEINGDFVNFGIFAGIHGQTIGGVEVSVVNGFGNDKGTLELFGTITSFKIGGQELWIDDVCPLIP